MQPDFNDIVETALASLGGSPTSAEVEAAAIRVLNQRSGLRGNGSPQIPAVRCSISLAACASRRSPTQRARVYDHVRKSADQVLNALSDTARTAGFPTSPSLELCIRDVTGLLAGHEPSEFLSISDAIHQAALDAGANKVLGPFLDLSIPDFFGYLGILPDVLGQLPHLTPLVQIGTDQDPPCSDVLQALGVAVCIHRDSRGSRDASLALTVNGCDRRAFGRRVSWNVLGLSIAYTGYDHADLACEFGLALAASHPENMRLVHLEERLSPQHLSPMGATGTSSYRGVRASTLLDGFPFFAPNQNRITFPDVLTPEEMASFLANRLSPFAQTGKEAGVLLDIKGRA